MPLHFRIDRSGSIRQALAAASGVSQQVKQPAHRLAHRRESRPGTISIFSDILFPTVNLLYLGEEKAQKKAMAFANSQAPVYHSTPWGIICTH